MTFSATAGVIDGAITPSSILRRSFYAIGGKTEGVVAATDLKVSPLSTPGDGIQISDGNALLLNRYQTNINETYVVSNRGPHILQSFEMPPTQATAKSYLVLVTVGDPEFSQVGHPWMPSEELTEEEAQEYQYIRPFLLEVPAGTTSFVGLGLNYPAYAVARLDIPANTRTITSPMIKDLRRLARPLTAEELQVFTTVTPGSLTTIQSSWQEFTGNLFTLQVPEWATKVKFQATIEGLVKSKAVNGRLRVAVVNGVGGTSTPFNESAPTSGSDRIGKNLSGEIDVSAYRGQTKTFRIEGQVTAAASQNGLATDVYTTSAIRLRFEEAAI